MSKIIVTHECPPIPDRRFDWLAYREGDEEGSQGWGRTKEDAIEELLISEEEAKEWADYFADQRGSE